MRRVLNDIYLAYGVSKSRIDKERLKQIEVLGGLGLDVQ